MEITTEDGAVLMPTRNFVNPDGIDTTISHLPPAGGHGRVKTAIWAAVALVLLTGCSPAEKASPSNSPSVKESTSTSDIGSTRTTSHSSPITSTTAGSPATRAEQSPREPVPNAASPDLPTGAQNEQTPPDDPAQQNHMDATSIAWFDTLCTGLAALANMDNPIATEAASGDITGTLTILSDSFARTAAALEAAPPPEFPGGKTLAAQLTSTLTGYAQAFARSVNEVSAADPHDPAAIAFAMAIVSDADAAGLKLDQLNISEETRASIGLIASCAALQF